MSEQLELQTFIASLPEVETLRLPRGVIFTANRLLYQVVETGAEGFHKARQWRCGEETDVALVPGSYLARFLPLVERGRLLPIFPTRLDLTDRGDPIVFLFPDERMALDAAYLDVALVKSGDAYVRNHGREPAFAATDGVHVFRVYYYSRTVHGRATQISTTPTEKTLQFRYYTRGPMHWRLLPTWRDATPWLDETIPNFPAVGSE